MKVYVLKGCCACIFNFPIPIDAVQIGIGGRVNGNLADGIERNLE
jgi:hypothetical protein